MRYEDLLRATDPRKILEAYSGDLGSIYGLPYGLFGSFADFSLKGFFNMSEIYQTAGQFSAKEFFNPQDYFDGSY